MSVLFQLIEVSGWVNKAMRFKFMRAHTQKYRHHHVSFNRNFMTWFLVGKIPQVGSQEERPEGQRGNFQP